MFMEETSSMAVFHSFYHHLNAFNFIYLFIYLLVKIFQEFNDIAPRYLYTIGYSTI
jgi:hypothetical protein